MDQEIKTDKQKYQKNLQEIFAGILISIAQFIIRILSRILMPFQFRLKKTVSPEIKQIKKGPLLIIANHKSYYDALIIANTLPVFFRGYPLRFIAKDQLFHHVVSRFFFWLIGAFPTFYGSGKDKSLEIPLRLLSQSGTVVFFPEGKCIREEGLGECKLGAAMLALQVPDIQILPIAIRDSYKIGERGLFARPNIRSVTGKPFHLKERVYMSTATPENVTQLFMKEIADLYAASELLKKAEVPA